MQRTRARVLVSLFEAAHWHAYALRLDSADLAAGFDLCPDFHEGSL